MKRWIFGVGGVAALVGGLVACPSFAPDDVCGYPGFCGDSSLTDAPNDGGNEGGCDPKTSNCIDPSKGVFVDGTNGNDTNDGSQTKPLKTIGVALTTAKSAAKSRVYICAGSYAENVDVKDAVDLLGGFACSDWSYTTKNDATIAPATGLALHVEGVTSNVSDLKFVSADATNAGESSIAVFAASATLSLVRDSVQAGKGMSATQPAADPDFSPMQADAGAAGTSGNGGGQQPNNCTNGSGSSTGGAGGPPGGVDGVKGQPFGAYTVNPTNATGVGGSSAANDCGNGSSGHNGSYGPGGDAGAGAAKLGTLDQTGWIPLGGAVGGIGLVGEGAGGGASLDSAGGGGGGGPGGCGGVGGLGGTGGGASIAVLSFNSTLTLATTTLATQNGGDGAKGGSGQKAQGGGNAGSFFATSCNGGSGGHGGSGGGGGGGAGGVSVGILYTGTSPTIDGTSTATADTLGTVTLGSPGAVGAGGSGGVAYKTNSPASNAGADGSPGPVGVAKAVMVAP